MPAIDNLDPALFGKVWTYKELLTAERPEGDGPRRRVRAAAHTEEKPDHWPEDTIIDPAHWVWWIPEGWYQGIKTTISGKTLKCYIAPKEEKNNFGFKRYFHKKDIETYLGYTLPTVPPTERPKVEYEGEPVAKRVKTVAESVPLWPEGDWLPQDWRVAYRQLPSGLHRIYIPPGQDEGFLYHRTCVMEYLETGGGKKLSPFLTSKPMSEIMAAAVNPKSKSSKDHKKQKKNLRRQVCHVTPEDYKENPCLTVCSLEVAEPNAAVKLTKELGDATKVNDLLATGARIHGLLLGRGFPNDTRLLAVVSRAATGSPHELAQHVEGIYFQLPDRLNKRPYYRRIAVVSEEAEGVLVCGDASIFWSSRHARWKMGLLNDLRAAVAICQSDKDSPLELDSPWSMLRSDFPNLCAQRDSINESEEA